MDSLFSGWGQISPKASLDSFLYDFPRVDVFAALQRLIDVILHRKERCHQLDAYFPRALASVTLSIV